jgi:hypothetical protein
MKILITLFILLFTLTLSAADYVFFFDPVSFPITNRLVRPYVMGSPHQTEFLGKTNALYSNILPGGIDLTQAKVENGFVVALSVADINRIAATNAVLEFNTQVAFTNSVRLAAKQLIQSEFTDRDLVLRAFMLVVLDEINIIRPALASPLSARTKLQFRNAIQTKIDSGVADIVE